MTAPIIDMHSHFIPARFPDRPSGVEEPAWPSLKSVPGGAQMFVGDTLFREFESYYWDVEGRIATLDRNDVAVQVISPLPELFSYWLDRRAGAVLTDAMNRECAAMVTESGGRLRGFGILALQDIGKAVEQVAEIAELGLVGVFAGSHVNGVSIANAQFHPVLAALEKHGLALFIHGLKPAGLDRIEGPGLMGAVLGVPYEGTMALGGFIATDVFGRFPKLKIIFAHGGGMIASIIDRMDLVWEKFPGPMQASLNIRPSEYARRFHYDTVVFSPRAVAFLAERFGAGCILAGTDGPTEIGQTDLEDFIAQTGLSQTDRHAILGGNAARVLDISL
ncbi:amidohydrolase family protein [Croceicoccus sp. YJ47]|uniref:amidohydrolase family protein n=1 Tax=Croceicoccus sp. YJ47 TaxID=2798724 RepID=UPI0019207523|nr:amidohydrolase family protein [Croceicoccus sp. YJ47]QQN75304.1 amidohydrolase [Croceicoccus sp. YJ47]